MASVAENLEKVLTPHLIWLSGRTVSTSSVGLESALVPGQESVDSK